MQRCCFDCEFFRLDGKDPEKLTDRDWDDGCAIGECHLHPPVIGDLLKRPDGTQFRSLGEYPQVFCSDWCGQFRKRKTAVEKALDEANRQLGLS